MNWIAPSAKDTATLTLKKRLWDAADQFSANSGLKSQECVLGELAMSEGQGGHVNSYHDDPHDATGRFDFVLANPPFNVNAVDKERLKDMVGPGRRFPLGMPRTDNADYLWIQLFRSALNANGHSGFVMASSASDAR